MASMIGKSIFIVILFTYVESYGLQNNYGPYRNMIIEDDRLCSESTKRKIELNKNKFSALEITTTTSKLHNFDWTYNKHCEFKISADDSFGVMAVIQFLNFRRHPAGNCIDYVQFKSKHGEQSEKFCGNFAIWNATSLNYFDNLPLRHSFISPQGKLETHIHIAKEKLMPEQATYLNIVYTIYKRCDGAYSLFCMLGDLDICIDSKYRNDGIVNCAFEGCPDELSCSQTRYRADDNDVIYNFQPKKHDTPLQLGIMAIVIIILCVVFCMCAYACKKTSTLCWSPNFSEAMQSRRQNTTVQVPDTPNEQLQSRNAPRAEPSAPPGDLPPSYDALFPNSK